jgi:CelD/BcsL family acetyltransferase involved in cellulose biosynthesis
VSVLYDIRKGSRQYNIKLGFDPAIERSFSLGLIHFGYAIEAACDDGIATYDFLAGRGRKTDYKSHLGQVRQDLVTVQLLKGPALSRLYRWYDARKTAHAARDDARD